MYKQEAVYIVISISVKYLKITKISPGLIGLREHFFGLIFWGAYILGGGLIFDGHFVLVSEYQDFKIYCYISLL